MLARHCEIAKSGASPPLLHASLAVHIALCWSCASAPLVHSYELCKFQMDKSVESVIELRLRVCSYDDCELVKLAFSLPPGRRLLAGWHLKSLRSYLKSVLLYVQDVESPVYRDSMITFIK